MNLEEFNALPSARAAQTLLDCCGSKGWAARMAAQRPFMDLNSLCDTADSIWLDLEPADWLEAFGRHPQIGERVTAGSESSRRWAEDEQAGARVVAENMKTNLTQANQAYQGKFGYIFIVCATGKSAEEILALLEQRLQNDSARELSIAAEQQRLITRLRLEKLLAAERSLR